MQVYGRLDGLTRSLFPSRPAANARTGPPNARSLDHVRLFTLGPHLCYLFTPGRSSITLVAWVIYMQLLALYFFSPLPKRGYLVTCEALVKVLELLACKIGYSLALCGWSLCCMTLIPSGTAFMENLNTRHPPHGYYTHSLLFPVQTSLNARQK